MYKFKIEKIKLKNNQEIIPNKINIIIGPNNSGKSKFLKEIADEISFVEDSKYIIDDIEMTLPITYDELNRGYNINERIFKDAHNNDRLLVYNNYNNQNEYPHIQEISYYENLISNSNKCFLRTFGGLFLNYLGTENRLIMLKEKEQTNRSYGTINFLATLHNSMISKGVSDLSIVSDETYRLFREGN